MRGRTLSFSAQPNLIRLDEPGAEPLRHLFHLGHRVIVNVLEAAEFMRPLDLVMRSAKPVAKCENDGLSGLGKMLNDPFRTDRNVQDGGSSRILRNDHRVPFIVRVETQMVDEKIAGFAVPAIIMKEP